MVMCHSAAYTGWCNQVLEFTQGCVITPETELYYYEWRCWRLCLPCHSLGLFKVHCVGSDLSVYVYPAVKLKKRMIWTGYSQSRSTLCSMVP